MKKITLFLFAFFLNWQVNAQFGCGSAVVITSGYTATGITTPGNGGIEDWSDLPPDSAGVTNFYWEDDVYLFQYTAGATSEEISMTTVSVNGWNGIGIFSNCSGTTFSGALDAEGTTAGNSTKTVTANIAPGQTVYIAVGQWGDPYDLNFSVTNFTATPLVNPPGCVTLSTPANNAINVSSSQISWPAATGAATAYKVSVGTAPGTTNILNNVNVGNVLTYNLGGLDAGTTYYVTVISSNSNGDATGCLESNFSTCDSSAIPFSEEFETITSGVPGCWGIAGTTTTANYNFTSFATGNIGRGLRFDSYNNTNGLTSELTTPLIDATGATSLRVSFYFKNPTGGNFEVLVSSDGGTTYTSLENNLVGVANWTLKSYNITSSISDKIKVKFKGTSNYGNGDAYVYLDGVTIEPIPAAAPNCSAILIPANGAINVSSGKITWATNIDAAGYKISVGTSSGATDVLNMFDVGSITNYTIATAPGTTYYVTVFPFNASGTATGCTEISFTTCDAFTVPFTEGFNSTSTTESCWTVLNVNNDTDAWDMNYVTNPIEGNQSAMLYTDGNGGNNNDWLISPKITLTGNQRVRFQRKMESNFEPNDFRMLVSTTGVDPADFTQVIMPLTSYANNTAETMTVSLAGITGNIHIAWHVPAGGLDGWRLYIDDVVVEDIPNVIPTCSTITTPVDAALNVTNSRVTWTASLDAAGYKIFAGTAPGATDVLNGVNTLGLTSYVVPTDPGSTYFVKIVPFNATGDAVGCTEISFTTCDALVPEFIETFSTFLPSCWQSADNGNLTTGPATFGASGWVADGFANAGTAGAIRYELWLASANDWVISPIVSIPVTGYELKFDAAATQYFGTTAPTTPWEADDVVEVLVSTTGFTNWTVLYTYNNTNVPAPTGTANVIDLDAYAGQDVRFAFRAVEGATDGSADIDFFIDNFEVRLTPSSVPVCATNIVATPNATCGNFASTITWNAVAGADGYRITVGATSGGTTIANNVNIGNTTTYSFVGNVGTTYYYTIVPFNAAGSAVGCTENSFATVATGCYCPSVPTSNDNSGISNVQISATDFPTSDVTYFDHTATVVDMIQGISNNVQVTFATGYAYNTYLYIDLNNDFDFNDAGELVYSGVSLGANPTTLNASFVMPGAAPLGQHRMRLSTGDGNFLTTSDPCYSGAYGVTLDFTVNVIATASTDSFDNARFVAYPNPVKDVLNLSYTSEISTVRVLNLLGQEVVSKAVNGTSTQVDMSQLSAGTYIVNVTVGDSIKSIKVIKQ